MLGRKIYLNLLICFIISCPSVLCSQGITGVPAIECLGNITNFSYTPPSGLTVSAASWTYGDGNGSASTNPNYTYPNKGNYTIRVTVTLSNSTVKTDSQKIQVVGIPKASFYYLPESDSCIVSNTVCYKDTSRPAAPGQNIVRRLFVWGDGTFDNSNTPAYGDRLCKQYSVPDKYNIRLEVTDIYGCRNIRSSSITILDNTKASFDTSSSYASCTVREVCFRNTSGGADPNAATYRWIIDTSKTDTSRYFSSNKCIGYKSDRIANARLIARSPNGCLDTFDVGYAAFIDPLPDSLVLSDTVMCASQQGFAEARITNVRRDAIRWYVDGNWFPLATGTVFNFIPKNAGRPGVHTVMCAIYRGNCTYVLKKHFRTIGPLANIKIIDDQQCFSTRQIFMYDTSLIADKKKAKYKWVIDDPNGDNCTAHRSQGINLNKNCNISLDSYTKHKFSVGGKRYRYSFTITDISTGCSDSIVDSLTFNYCSSLLSRDSIPLCQNKLFTEDASGPMPQKFSFDSGKTWKTFPSLIDTAYYGKYPLSLIFKSTVKPWAENFGNDSFRIHYDSVVFYDTVHRPPVVNILKLKTDTLSFKFSNKCKPYRATVYFKNGNFYKGEILRILWGNTADEYAFDTFTHIDSLSHPYNEDAIQGGLVKVYMYNTEGCEYADVFNFSVGKVISKYNDPMVCYGNSTCFFPSVYDISTQSFWKNNTAGNRVSWIFPDTSGPVTVYKPCYKFKTPGWKHFQMLVNDSFGCQYTLKDSIFVQEIRADVKNESRQIYCSELKQFFDSSYILKYDSTDRINKYAWDFGTGVFSTLQKNPLKSLNLAVDTIYARLKITGLYGCTDTTTFKIAVIGSKPYFTIKDTIGCDSLTAVFLNNSRNCKKYIWEFGDPGNQTLETTSKLPVSFTYNTPGRYYIHLVGIDTVYNPVSGKPYYCYNRFPDKDYQKDTNRSVLVLPVRKTGLSSNFDTICLGNSITFTSHSAPDYDKDYWDFGDSTFDTLSFPNATATHVYAKQGVFRVKLNPAYNDSSLNVCRDSARKDITVLDVKADFDVDPNSSAPVFLFKNKSAPAGVKLRWDFGHPASGPANTSSDENPSHNYDMDTGSYQVCLIAELPAGCSDTVCKTVLNDYIVDFRIGNIFTPGAKDGKNDRFDIAIEGEDFYELRIYNRWGVMVYEGNRDADNSESINWDGTFMNNGTECSSGTYFYVFRYRLKSKPQNTETVNGVITLVR